MFNIFENLELPLQVELEDSTDLYEKSDGVYFVITIVCASLFFAGTVNVLNSHLKTPETTNTLAHTSDFATKGFSCPKN